MLINGEPGQTIPVNDRGLLYGDGIFETIRVINRQLSLWQLHQRRLLNSCNLLGIDVDLPKLLEELNSLLGASAADGIAKVIVTRGVGGRGYQPGDATEPTRIVQFHPLPDAYNQDKQGGVRVKFCNQPITVNSRLGGLKHLGRLDQVMASSELTDEYDEGLMSTDSGLVVEGTKSNLFVVINDSLVTPGLHNAGVAGVMREYLMGQFATDGFPVHEAKLNREDLLNASEVFLCNSVFGVWPVTELVYENKSHNKKVGRFTRLALEFQDNEFCSYN